ncbi:MAG TPA: NAD(P)-dependent oxidoreductase [Acidimicrobiales bacterium]|nr:NAD(P)-dependent oxidoreductase [Acidimicrobiales bacterium]
MILITGGLGFIGLHTARALIDMGEEVVLTQYRVPRAPAFIKDDFGKTAFIERLDVTDADALAAIGKRHQIDSIIHLAVPGLGALSAAEDFHVNMTGLLNVLRAAEEWKVRRVSIASSLAIYGSILELPHREDMTFPLSSTNPTEAYKKAYEVLANHYADRTGLDLVNLRIAAIWGPLYHSMSNLPSRLVHAAVKGFPAKVDGPRGPSYLEDGWDLCYAPDCGRAIALLQVAKNLSGRTYNIGSGRGVKNRELLEAVQKVMPEFTAALPAGHAPGSGGEIAYMDLSLIKRDVGYEPQFSTDAAIADYIAWLQAGNEE